MPAPHLLEGGTAHMYTPEELGNGYNVYSHRGTVTDPLLSSAARQGQTLHLAAQKKNIADFETLWVKDERLTYIQWGVDEVDDSNLEQRIHDLTGTKTGSIFKAARQLLRVAGYDYTPHHLAMFRTMRKNNISLHRDGEKSDSDFIADNTWSREFLNLRGKRVVGFARIPEEVPTFLTIKPGDSYSLPPQGTYHSVDYVDDSLAIYVQDKI